MELSLFLAKLLGLLLTAIGLGFLFNPGHYQKTYTDWMKNAGLLYLAGIMALIVGFVLVQNHNFWASSWTVIITIFAWMALIKGVFLLLFPKVMIGMCESMLKSKSFFTFGGIVILALGVILGYFGFFA